MHETLFQKDSGRHLSRIVGWSIAFHVVIVLVVIGVSMFTPPQEPKKIPIFEVIQLPPPKGKPKKKVTRIVQPAQEVPPPEVKPEIKPEPNPQPKPIPKPELKPEIKPDPKPTPKPETKPTPAPETPKPKVEPQAVPEPEPVEDDFDLPESHEPEGELDGMALPNMMDLRAVGGLDMDPLMQVYLEQLQMILMSNFTPPSGLKIARNARSSVQFTIQRNGAMTAVILKKSSGNPVWDQQALRAVKISRLPPLPPNYRAMVLPLVFDFREK